jgi:HEPN domain-containing protein
MNKPAVSEWIVFSKMDLASAKHLCSMNPKPLEIICYHCQQAAEKALKAYWVYSGIAPPKTHDLERLRDKCESFNKSFEELENECDRLNVYSSQPRYPFGLELTDDIMILAIKDSEKILEFVKLKLDVYE